MELKSKTKGLFSIHLAVLLFGLAGLFGKWLVLPALTIVFGRVLFAAISLGIYASVFKVSLKINTFKDFLMLFFLGLLLAFHWFAFFHSIQLSSVAIGLLTYSVFPVVVVFLEPIFFKEKIRKVDLLLALITLLGVFLIIPEFNLKNNITSGVLWGLSSGVSFALISILNRNYVKKYSGLTIAFYEDTFAIIVLLPFFSFSTFQIGISDLLILILLGVVFTAVAHTLFISGLKSIKAQLASIIACLEPVYGILFAFLLLKEIPATREIIGGLIIIAAILLATVTHHQIISKSQ